MRWFLPLLIVLGLAAGVIFFSAEWIEFPFSKARPPGPPPPATAPETARVPSNRKRFTFFFVEPDGGGLRPEARDLPRPSTLRASIRQLLEELIRGSRTGLVETLPRSSRVLEIFLDGQGTVYVDFSREVASDHPGGVWAEAAAVASVVQTLTVNFEALRKVAFLIEGKTVETLAGHVDVRTPLTRLDTRAFSMGEESPLPAAPQPSKP